MSVLSPLTCITTKEEKQIELMGLPLAEFTSTVFRPVDLSLSYTIEVTEELKKHECLSKK